MDAMILAAGLGTRLKPLTDRVPKALIEVGGSTMLERTARRLITADADRIVVNVHHHADQLRGAVDRLAADYPGVEFHVSEEDRPLETGGGLAHAAHLFRGDRPIMLHNVDVLSDLDLGVASGLQQPADGSESVA